MTTVPLCETAGETDSACCRKCGQQNFRYRDLGSYAERECQTPGCEGQLNGRLPFNTEQYPFIRVNLVSSFPR